MGKEYYIGLDIGTGSVGFAATDINYEVLKTHGKAEWGVRLFDTAQTAAERRFSRVNRRRIERRRQRILLLQELFAEEIAKIDPGFFSRLNDSFFYPEDKAEVQSNTLFNDPAYKDADYHKQYPTIYHLRYDLMTNNTSHDPRLVYLALAHILKTRGHFLYSDTGDFELGKQYEAVFNELTLAVEETLNIAVPPTLAEPWHQILTDRTISNSIKQAKLLDSLQTKDKNAKSLVKLLTGYDTKFADLFGEQYKEASPKNIKLSKLEDETLDQVESVLSEEHFSMILIASSYYNLVRLEALLQGADSLSQTKINIYQKHAADLKKLKALFKKYCPDDAYKRFFALSEKGLFNYTAYSGHLMKNKRKLPVVQKCDKEKFTDYLKKFLNGLPDRAKKSEDYQKIVNEIEIGSFLPKITDKDNSLIPHQLHQAELKKILDSASTYLPFLNKQGKNGYTYRQMIELISNFKIPYYVGPLNPAHSVQNNPNSSSHHAWLTKLSDEPVRPWNFNQVIDIEQSATDFIGNLTNKCSYLIGEDVLPKDSPIYAKYSILNLLNVVTVKSQPLQTPLKQEVFEYFFLNPNRRVKLTKKRLAEFIQAKNGEIVNDSDIDGMDLEIPGEMKAEIAIERIAAGKLTEEEKETLVRLITVFPDSPKMISNRITRDLGEKLSSNEINQLSKLKFSGWGRLSEKFLNGISALNQDNQFKTILDLMWEESLNLMQVLAEYPSLRDQIQYLNDQILGAEQNFGYQIVENYPISPPVKRMVWQTLRIIKELIKVNRGTPPSKIFLEVAREEGEKVRTVSRKTQLLELYKNLKKQGTSLYLELESRSEAELRSKKLFLYFTQMGRCIYTGEQISIESLNNRGADGHDIYDIDHIYPRSITKDDSILNNLVLVKSQSNRDKGDTYPINGSIRNNMLSFWSQLKNSNLITEEKYRRLTRNSELSLDELANFINRQLVETRQAAKAAADIIKQFLPETRLVYVKAGHISDFRYKQSNFRFPKVRGMNDLHHAKDAYLNIVVGNVFDSKFSENPFKYLKNNPDKKYNLARMYDFEVRSMSKQLAWQAGPGGSIAMVRKMMARNNILVTYQTHHQHSGQNGGIFDQNILPKGQGQFPIKTSDPRFCGEAGIAKYGAYSKETGATFFLVEHRSGKKILKTIMPLGLAWYLTHSLSEEALQEYCEKDLGLIEPKILVSDLPYNAIIAVDGYPLRILAKTGSSLKMANSVQPIFNLTFETILREVFFQLAREVNEDEEPKAVDKIKDDFIVLYDEFINKLGSLPFSGLSAYANQVENLKKGREKFQELSLKDQAKLLNQALTLFLCGPQLSDLSLISPLKNGKPQNTQVGMITLSQNLPWETKKIEIINYSVSGLFEQRINVS